MIGAEYGGDCSSFLPSDNTYQAVVNLPGELNLDITYLRNTFNYSLTDELSLVWLLGYEKMDRSSAQDNEVGLGHGTARPISLMVLAPSPTRVNFSCSLTNSAI